MEHENWEDCLMHLLRIAYAKLRRLRFGIMANKKFRGYIEKNKIRKLQLGSWKSALDSWLNTDLYARRNILPVDVTKKFPFDDCVFDYIFTEHLIEHLEYGTGKKMLKECFRVMKKGGRIRVATPDLAFLIKIYNSETEEKKKYVKCLSRYLKITDPPKDAQILNMLFRKWGHRFIYDFETLKLALEEAGFEKVQSYKVGESDDPELRNIETHGTYVGEEINKLETFVVEAVKPA